MQLAEIERWIQRDPGGRGFLSRFGGGERPCPGGLRDAADELVRNGKSIGVVTGFFVPDAPLPSAETDGPIGSILLADVLRSDSSEAFLITDSLCASVVRAAVNACGLDLDVEVCPLPPDESRRWRESFWKSDRGTRLTHLVSVERVGPVDSDVPEAAQCRNMRGMAIDAWSADLYRLFEQRPARVRTIGIGDGGNEIGMGRCWQDAAESAHPPNACRTVTDWTIIAGVSDWGAMALAAAVCLQKGDVAPLKPWTSARIEHALTQMVAEGPAIDGCTFLPEPTVDGLPFAAYIQPWDHIRRELVVDRTRIDE